MPSFSPDPPAVGASDGAIWLYGETSPTLVRFDTAASAVTSYQVPGWHLGSDLLGGTPKFALGSIWLRTSDDFISRIDPATGAVTATYPAYIGGGEVAVAFGSLWVANVNTDTVWRDRIDP